MPVAYYFDEGKNPGGQAVIFGVPHGDISDEEFAGYPKHIQESVAKSEMYRRTKPEPKAAPAAAPAKPKRVRPSRAKAKAPVVTAPAAEKTAAIDSQESPEAPQGQEGV